MLFIHETFLVYKLETFNNFKQVKHIMIMIIAIIYIFFILCDIWSTVENCFQKIFSPPPEKIHSCLFTHSPPKNQKVKVPSFCQNWKFFRLPLQRRGEDTVVILIQGGHSSKILFYFYFIHVDNLKTLGLKYSQHYLNMLIKFNEI